MTENSQTFGFPPGYFVIRSVATQRMWDVTQDEVEDGTEIILWPVKEFSLVESLRMPEANNQVFYIDTAGALCSRSSGHAIDVEDEKLVLRHRRPVSQPFPNAYSHPLPQFSYNSASGQISVTFACDPAYPSDVWNASNAWTKKTYVLTSIPMRKPRTLIDDASEFLTTGVSNAFSFLSGGPKSPGAKPDDVFSGQIDLAEDEVLEQEMGEENEVDDSAENLRRLRVLALSPEDVVSSRPNARTRRGFEVLPLRNSKATSKAR